MHLSAPTRWLRGKGLIPTILCALCLAGTVIAAVSPMARAAAAGVDSEAVALALHVVLSGQNQILLTATVNGNQEVFFDAERSFAPLEPGTVNLYITLDGVKISNDSVIDWRDSKAPAAHSFRGIDAHRIPPGSHVVALVADAVNSRPYVTPFSRPIMTPHLRAELVLSP